MQNLPAGALTVLNLDNNSSVESLVSQRYYRTNFSLFEVLRSVLQHMSTLQHLWLNVPNVRPYEAQMLASALELGSLRTLNLRNCPIDCDETLNKIILALPNHRQLRRLSLEGKNRVIGPCDALAVLLSMEETSLK